MYVDQNLYHGRPVSGQRLDKELRCYDLLDRLGSPTTGPITTLPTRSKPAPPWSRCLAPDLQESFPHEPAADGILSAADAGHKPFRTKDLSHQIGSARLSFASPEHMRELLDITPGSVSVLG